MKSLLFYILISVFIIQISCNNCGSRDIYQERISQVDSVFIKKWVITKGLYPFKATLKFNKDYSFQYEFLSGFIEGYSQGTWVVDYPYIILNSIKVDSCMYRSRFGKECITFRDFYELDKILNATTIEGCHPLSQTQFVIFYKDTFRYSNYRLFYLAQDLNQECPIKHIYYLSKKNIYMIR